MTAYLEKVHELLGQFETTIIIQVPWSKSSIMDALAQLATNLEDNLLKMVHVEVLETLSIEKIELVAQVVLAPCWMDPFISYPRDKKFPGD